MLAITTRIPIVSSLEELIEDPMTLGAAIQSMKTATMFKSYSSAVFLKAARLSGMLNFDPFSLSDVGM